MTKMMMLAVLAAMMVAGCKKKAPEEGPMPTGSGQAMGSGGAMGSAMGSAGTGSGMEGSGSAGSAAATAMTGEDLAKRFDQCWGFFNDSKWDDLKTCFAADAVREMPGGPMPPITGNDAIIGSLKALKDPMPDLKGEQGLELVDGHTIVAVSLQTGTMTGTMKSPMGDMPATKNKIGLLTAQVLDANDKGEATHDSEFEDLATMFGQMKPDPKHPVRPAMDKLPMEKTVVVAKDDDAEKANKDVANKVMDAFNNHDAKAMAGLVTDDVKWSEQSNPKDWDKKALETNAAAFFKAFPDAKLSNDKQYAAGNYVATVGSLTGTNNGDMPEMHLKKTGKKVDVPYLMVQEIENGKVKNAWLFDQGLAFASQLGLLPAQAPAAPGGAKK